MSAVAQPLRFGRARLLSIGALLMALWGVAYVLTAIYWVATDAFVAPLVLSPDSDLVIQSKLSLAQLLAERGRVAATREELEAQYSAAEAAIVELTELLDTASRGLDFTSSVKATQAALGGDTLKAIDHQRDLVVQMVKDQEALVEQMGKALEVGLVSNSEYALQTQALGRMKVELLENQRAQLATEAQLGEVKLTREAMHGAKGRGLSTPEMLMQRDQVVRIRCDLLKLEAERRANRAQWRRVGEEVAKVDELLGQLKARPVFRATEARTNVAFVPYSQIQGVDRGARIYDCVWGLVACRAVGTVSELLPGEVIVPDPWGTPARGQYALIDLSDQFAALSRTLRIRPLPASAQRPAATGPIAP